MTDLGPRALFVLLEGLLAGRRVSLDLDLLNLLRGGLGELCNAIGDLELGRQVHDCVLNLGE
jgi:hypothetical protein